ncbi:hypothetical protein [Acinetobacter gandensis]|uniref:hypothetical protein n=1 Tax=Acinetobacter gandensis TaxID=1443941 RepID=UPI0012DCDBD6|nr:hypothetical protein [Acinetobacter gandensis]
MGATFYFVFLLVDLALVVLGFSPLDLLALASVFFSVEDFLVVFFSAFGFSSLTLVLVFDVVAFLGASFLLALDFGELLVDADFLAFTFSSLVAASFLEVLSLDFFQQFSLLLCLNLYSML